MKKTKFLLILILLFSFLIRFYRLNSLPLFGDEIDVGYQAFSLLNTARDYRGYFLPFYTESLSESRAPLLIYLTIPFVKIFGLTVWGVRLLPVIAGVVGIFFLYKLILLLTRSESLSLFSTLALSLMPWHYLYSRAAFEVTLLISLILIATFYFFSFVKNNLKKNLFLSIFFFGLSFYTYNTANIFVPLLVIYLLVSNWQIVQKHLTPKDFFISIFLTLLLITPLAKEILWGKAAERISLISIFKSNQVTEKIIQKRTSWPGLNLNTEKFFHNKAETIGKTFFHNLISSYSLNFLFFGDNQNNARHSLPGFGLIFISFLPALLIGLFRLKLKDKTHLFFLYWLLIAPIPAALTLDGGTHPTRLFLMTVPLAFFIASGLDFLKKYQPIFILLSLALVIELSLFAHEYFVHYPKDTAQLWNHGYQELFSTIESNPSGRLFISNSYYNSLLPYLFYNQILPNSIQLDDHEHLNIIEDMPGFKISDSIYFINDWRHHNDIFQKISQFATPGDTFLLFQLKEIPGNMDLSVDPLKGYQSIKTVYNPDRTILGQIIQKQ